MEGEEEDADAEGTDVAVKMTGARETFMDGTGDTVGMGA